MPTEAPLQSIVKGAVDQLARSLNDLGSIVSGSIEKSGQSATSGLTTVISSVNATLGQIKSILAGVINVNAIYADGESSVYNGFSGSLTSTTALTVWTPSTGKRFLLKGYAITGIVSPDVLAASAGVLIYLADGGNSNAVVAPVATIHKTAAADVTAFTAGNSGTSATGTPVVVNLGSGRRGSATGSSGTLKLTTDITIGSGDIKVVGVVWGREV